jgi:glycosyltransferase involved in cell wall biosynthesis
MKVSVITPVRNMGEFLERALNSVAAQTYPIHELVVYDDGSTDNSHEIAARSGATSVISNLRTENPVGIAHARNEAFRVTTGQLILPLDADDWIEPTYVEKTVAAMTPFFGIVSTNMMYHEKREGQVMIATPQTYDTQLEQNNITVTSLVRREAILEAGPWDHNLRGWEDWDMWLRILDLGWAHTVVNETLFHYRLHDGGMNRWANEHKRELVRYLRQKHPRYMDYALALKDKKRPVDTW